MSLDLCTIATDPEPNIWSQKSWCLAARWMDGNSCPGAWLLGRLLRHTPFGEWECRTARVQVNPALFQFCSKKNPIPPWYCVATVFPTLLGLQIDLERADKLLSLKSLSKSFYVACRFLPKKINSNNENKNIVLPQFHALCERNLKVWPAKWRMQRKTHLSRRNMCSWTVSYNAICS